MAGCSDHWISDFVTKSTLNRYLWAGNKFVLNTVLDMFRPKSAWSDNYIPLRGKIACR